MAYKNRNFALEIKIISFNEIAQTFNCMEGIQINKNINKGIFSASGIFILEIIIGILFTPFLITSLGQIEYGVYSIIAAFMASFILLDLGVSNTIVRYLSEYRSSKSDTKISNLLTLSFLFYLVISIISLIIGLIVYFNLNNILGSSFNNEELEIAKKILLVLIINIIISFFLAALNAYLQAHEKFYYINILNITRSLIRVSILVILLSNGYKSLSIVIVDTLLNIIVGLIYYLFIKSNYNPIFNFRSLDFSNIKEMTKYSMLIFVNNASDILLWRVGVVILGIVRGPADVAIYSISIMLLSYFRSISGIINNNLFPFMTNMVTKGYGGIDLTNEIIKIARYQILILFPVLIGFWGLGKDFIILWIGKEYITSWLTTILLMIAIIPQSILYPCVLILRAKKKDGIRTIAQFIIVLLGSVLGYIFTLEFGMIGMGIGLFLMIFSINGFAINLLYVKIFDFKILEFSRQMLNLFPPIIASFIMMYLIQLLPFENWSGFLIKVSIFITLYFILIWNFVLFNEEIKVLKKFIFKLKLRGGN